MPQTAAVQVRCDFCGLYLGDREVEEVKGDHLTIPCRNCYAKKVSDLPASPELQAEWALLERSLEKKRTESLVYHPGAPPPQIDVNMEYSSATDSWTFVTPRPLTSQAFSRAKKAVYEQYKQILSDFGKVPPDVKNAKIIDELNKSIVALKANRVRNVVDQNMLEKRIVSF